MDGEELVNFYVKVWKGEEVNGRIYTTDQSMEAARWLGDRGWGKAIQQSLVETHQGGMRDVLATWTLEEVLAFRAELVAAQNALPEAQVIDGEPDADT